MIARYSETFKKIIGNYLYPITGFYYSFLESSLRYTTADEVPVTEILTGSTYGRSALRVASCIRIKDYYQINIPLTDTTISNYYHMMLLYIDNTELTSVSNWSNLDQRYYNYLKIAMLFDDIENSFLLKRSNFFTLTSINCDFKRVLPSERDFIEHLDGYSVDKRTATDIAISDEQFIEKDSGIDWIGENLMNDEREYNCFRLNPSGILEF